MKYVVTGATGHIGNNLVRFLLAQNEKVIVLARRQEDKALAGLDIDIKVGSLFDESFLETNIDAETIVIHAAGVIDITGRNNKQVYEVNVEATKKIVDVSLKKQVIKFIYIGSVDACYKDSKDGLIKEPDYFDVQNLRGAYAKSKALAGNYVLDKIKNNGLNGVIILPSAVIGPNDFKISSVGQAVLSCIKNEPMAIIKGGYNFIDVRDLSYAIYQSSIKKTDLVYFVTGYDMTVEELIKAIYDHLQKDKLPPHIPLGLVKIGAVFMPLIYQIKHEKPVFTLKALKTLNENHNYDNSKAKKDLTLTVRNPKESVNDLIDWFIEKGYHLQK